MAPDTQQNLIYTVYFTIAHNFLAMTYLGGIIMSVILGLLKPKRYLILLTIGFALLLFGFQYEKHIVDSLREQTTNALITERQSFRIQRVIDVTLGKALPFFVTIGGIGSIVLSGLVWYFFDRKKPGFMDTLKELFIKVKPFYTKKKNNGYNK